MKDDSLSINTFVSINFCVTETSSKMAPTLSQKGLTFFYQKAQNFVYFVPYDFVQISVACDPNNVLPNNVWRNFRLLMSASVMVT